MADPTRIVVPGRTRVYLAQVGTTAPANSTAALAAGWTEVGLTTADSLSFATEPEFEEVTSAQSDFPTRRFQTSDGATVSVDLQEWSKDNFIYAFGGGTVTQVSAGQYKFVPPSLGSRSEFAAIIEIIDGAKHYRYVFPRVMQVEGVEQELQKGQEARLPLRLAVLGSDGVDAFYLLTDDPAFAAA